MKAKLFLQSVIDRGGGNIGMFRHLLSTINDSATLNEGQQTYLNQEIQEASGPGSTEYRKDVMRIATYINSCQ